MPTILPITGFMIPDSQKELTMKILEDQIKSQAALVTPTANDLAFIEFRNWLEENVDEKYIIDATE